MINANELRIGNWIYSEDVKMEYQVDAYGILVASRTPDNRSPIPLTPEVLEACGFEKPDGLFRMDIKYIGEQFPCYLLYLEHTKSIEICRSGIYAVDVPCASLHQLQNLYYALTETELNYSPSHTGR